ncbi:hypothetical protein LSH36_127g13018 [Paralvinella palmiformis]|uniref:Uncharacterized protein n=1 Tax=Paralvinella palmiformis TaxID=53620 RepID=A0AAD9N8I5_9ANNE|nr:hypothetical protein LSH36_127g13018 [Paralvinella palmiformis]
MSVKSLADPAASLKVVANGRDGYVQVNDSLPPVEPEYDDSLIHKVGLDLFISIRTHICTTNLYSIAHFGRYLLQISPPSPN